MPPTSGDLTLSPVTPQSPLRHRRPDDFTTRRLSAAIDALRREGEAVLWELNSLMTQNSTLEQRILGHTEELDMIARGLVTLREQHRAMEQQYQEKLRALRRELRAAQEGRSSVPSRSLHGDVSSTARERRRSLSPPNSPELFRNQHRLQLPEGVRNPHPLSPLARITPSPPAPINRQDDAANAVEDTNSADIIHTRINRPRFQHSNTPPHLRPATSFESPSSSSPQGSRLRPRASPHDHPSDDPQSLNTHREPSLSPTATLVGSDAPIRPRPKKART